MHAPLFESPCPALHVALFNLCSPTPLCRAHAAALRLLFFNHPADASAAAGVLAATNQSPFATQPWNIKGQLLVLDVGSLQFQGDHTAQLWVPQSKVIRLLSWSAALWLM